ncbi:Protein of unknown function, partial [Gryllus bimaculatus]
MKWKRVFLSAPQNCVYNSFLFLPMFFVVKFDSVCVKFVSSIVEAKILIFIQYWQNIDFKIFGWRERGTIQMKK